MSIIAYDGRIIAADRQCTQYQMARTATKLVRSGSMVLGWVGDLNVCMLIRQWFEAGADPEEWPEAASEEDGDSVLVVATAKGVGTYRQYPVLLPLEDTRWAWGSGCEIALGCMDSGKTAIEAVEIVSRLNVYCGLGVDWFRLSDLPKEPTAEDRVRAKAKGKRKTGGRK